MRTHLLFALCAFALFLSITSFASPYNLYVSPTTGSDGDAVVPNDCKNRAAPCATILHSVNVSSTNDAVVLLPGTHIVKDNINIFHNLTIVAAATDKGVDIVHVLTNPFACEPAQTKAPVYPEQCSVFVQNSNTGEDSSRFFAIFGNKSLRVRNAGIFVYSNTLGDTSLNLELYGFVAQNLMYAVVYTKSQAQQSRAAIRDVVVSDSVLMPGIAQSVGSATIWMTGFQEVIVSNTSFSNITQGRNVQQRALWIQNANRVLLQSIAFSNCELVTLGQVDHANTIHSYDLDISNNRILRKGFFVSGIKEASFIRSSMRHNTCSVQLVSVTGELVTLLGGDKSQLVLAQSLLAQNNSVGTVVQMSKNEEAFLASSDIDGSGLSNYGCAQFMDNDSVNIKDTKFRNCVNQRYGGAVSSTRDAVVWVTATQFLNNTAWLGGAVALSYAASVNFKQGCVFQNNSAKYLGGAIYLQGGLPQIDAYSSKVTISSSLFRGNYVPKGAGNFGSAIYCLLSHLIFDVELLTGDKITRLYENVGYATVHAISSRVEVAQQAQVLVFNNYDPTVSGFFLDFSEMYLGDNSFMHFHVDAAHSSSYGIGVWLNNHPKPPRYTGSSPASITIRCESENTQVQGYPPACIKYAQSIADDAAHSVITTWSQNVRASENVQPYSAIPRYLRLTSFSDLVQVVNTSANVYAAPPEVLSFSLCFTLYDSLGVSIHTPTELRFQDLFSDQERAAILGFLGQNCVSGLQIKNVVKGMHLQVTAARNDIIFDRFEVTILPSSCPRGYMRDTSGRCFYAAIVYIVVTVSALFILTLFVGFVSAIIAAIVHRVRQVRAQRLVDKLIGKGISLTSNDFLSMTMQSQDNLFESFPAHLLINRDDLKIQHMISQGAQGIVCCGLIHGEQVACKLFGKNTLVFAQQADLQTFCSEASLLHRFSSHPSITRFIGICDLGQKVAIVSELMHGSLAQYIIMNNALKQDLRELGVDFSIKLKILKSIASGMAFLHSHDVLHRDLKPDNVLYAQLHGAQGEIVAKLADFGTAKQMLGDAASNATLNVGTSSFIAPECISGTNNTNPGRSGQARSSYGTSTESTPLRAGSTAGRYSKAIDVYSYGMTMFCLLFETTRPYGSMSDVDIMYNVHHNGLQPEFEETSFFRSLKQQGERNGIGSVKINSNILRAQSVLELMKQCLEQDPSKRPTFREIVSALES